jgi:hypothetical protein
VFEHVPPVTCGEETTTTLQTGRYNSGATPYHDAGIDGSAGGGFAAEPQVLMMLDTGIQPIRARVPSHRGRAAVRIDPDSADLRHRARCRQRRA